jgi:hypothetical protein
MYQIKINIIAKVAIKVWIKIVNINILKLSYIFFGAKRKT